MEGDPPIGTPLAALPIYAYPLEPRARRWVTRDRCIRLLDKNRLLDNIRPLEARASPLEDVPEEAQHKHSTGQGNMNFSA